MEKTTELFHGEHFVVEDLLDFSNEDGNEVVEDGDVAACDATTDDSTAGESCNPSSFSCENGSLGDVTNFSGDLCVPYDDLAELEWLSNFVEEESFSTEDIQKLHLISGFKTRPESKINNPNPDPHNNSPIFTTDASVPAKARSKRSRAAACNWASSGFLSDNLFSPETVLPGGHDIHPPPPPPPPLRQPKKSGSGSRKENPAINRDTASGAGSGCNSSGGGGCGRSSCGCGGDGRRCLHCATDKTPQWRTGPMGPKTLCNACGVRYKSGRLVPEYRPAASPTFVLTKHSNSHRKVMELRRQKEVMRAQQQVLNLPTDSMVFDLSSDGDDFLIHQNIGPDFSQLI